MHVVYQEFIKGINKGIIRKLVFAVKGYAHYRHCEISREKKTICRGERSVCYDAIKVALTNDPSEHVSFWDTYNESYQLFRMGRKGSFTLKQMWDKIEILSIEYNK